MADLNQSAQDIPKQHAGPKLPPLPEAQSAPSSSSVPVPVPDPTPNLGSLKSSAQSNYTHSQTILVRRKRKDELTWKGLRKWFVNNQIGLSVNLLALLLLTHLSIPKARPHTRKFLTLAYHNPQTGRYAPGLDDSFLVSFLIVLLVFLRASAMQQLFAHLGRKLGIAKRKTLQRFCEQAWTMVSYLCLWITGMYTYYRSGYFMSIKDVVPPIWPIREETWLTKVYFLTQIASCLHLIIVLHIEEARKDHYQMLTHHFVTLWLLTSCYFCHYTHTGNVVLVLMDPADVLLPLAKCLKYAHFTKLCDFVFGLFMLTWFILRHILYPICWYEIFKNRWSYVDRQCYRGSQNRLEGPLPVPEGFAYLLEPFYDPEGYVCSSTVMMVTIVGSLAFLELIIMVWSVLIVRIAIRVISGRGAADTRSDDEKVESDEEIICDEEVQPFEMEVGVEEINFKAWERRSGPKRQGISSAVTLPGHSDRKELLGRIGCDKQMD